MHDQPQDESQVPIAGAAPLQVIANAAPNGWRMKLAKAAAQLIAGSEKGAVAYGEIRERLDTIEGRSIVAKGMAEAVAQQAMSDPEIMERAKARFLGATLQKQENLEAVIIGASHPPLALPPPVENSVEAGASDEPAASPAEDVEEPLNPDWAAAFSEIAEKATSDELRARLSRVLAGELARPGTYSRSTVRQIAELEKPDLEAMQRVLPYVVGDAIVRLEKDSHEPTIDMLLPLAEAGLVAEASNMLSKTWPAAPKDGTETWFGGKAWVLRFTLKKGQALSVPVTQLTRTGIAVVDLLGRQDEKIILKRFVDGLDAETFSVIGLGRIVGPDRVALPLEQLRPAPVARSIVTAGAYRFSPPTVS